MDAINQPDPLSPPAGCGMVYLDLPQLPTLGCTLAEFSGAGCRCRVLTSGADRATFAAWRGMLWPNQKLQLKLAFGPGIPSVDIEGRVQSVAAHADGIEMALSFDPFNAELQAIFTHMRENKSGAAPAAPGLDVTQEMQRPKKLEGPTAKTLTGAALAVDATVEMERPAALQARATSEKAAAPGLADTMEFAQSIEMADAAETAESAHKPEIDPRATVEMAHPDDVRNASQSALLDATVDMQRSASPEALNATVEMQRPVVDAPLSATGFETLVGEPIPLDRLYAPKAPDERRTPERGSHDAAALTPSPGWGASPPPAYSKKIGEVLVQMGKLSREQVDEAVQLSHAAGERFGSWLIRWELVQPEALCRALSIQSGLPMTLLDGDAIPEPLRKLFPLPLMMHHHFVPFDESGALLCVAACNPLDPEMLREQEKTLKKSIEVFLAREDQVARQLDWLRIKMKNRSRRSLRFAMRLPASYQFCNRLGVRTDKDVHAGSTVNISEGGYLLEVQPVAGNPDELLVRGLYINVCIKTMTGEIWTICDVREIRVVEEGQARRWLLGAEILEITPDCKARLKTLCKRSVKPA